MHPIRRLARAVKAAAVGVAMRFSGAGRTGWAAIIRGSRFDYAGAVGSGDGNSAVMACCNFLMRAFPEAPVQVGKRNADGKVEWLSDHAMVELLERPNPYYSGVLLWMATILDFTLTGNTYWLKARNGQGGIAELWWVPSFMMEPKWPSDGTEYITHYEYTPNGTALRREASDVVHFRFGVDPRNTRKGLSPLASALREVFTDDEAANFGAALLRNFGVPGVVIAPKGDASFSPDDAEVVKANFVQKTGGDRRGEPLVMSDAVDMTVMSFSPQQMDLKMLRRLPEERITAVLGIPAIVAGLGAGLDRSTFANMAEARQMAYESNIIPTQRLMASDIKTQLLSDFGDTKGMVVRHDNSEVRVLQDDQDALYRRADMGIKGGWMTVGQGLAVTGQSSGPEHDYYLRSVITVAIPASEAGAPPALPEPTAPKMLGPGQTKAVAVAGSREAWITRMAGPYERELAAVFKSQEAAVIRAWNGSKARPSLNGHTSNYIAVETKVAVDDLLGNEWDSLLGDISTRYTFSVAGDIIAQIGTSLGIDGLFDLALPRVQQTAERLATRITSVNETTRSSIRRAIAAGSDAGESVEATATRIRDVMQNASQGRARTISRTEIGTALNLSATDAWEASGIVKGILITDGDGDEECASANGETWTIERFRDEPLGHPNCTRAGTAVIGQG